MKRKKIKIKQKQTSCMRSGIMPSPEGTGLLFAGTVSPMMCPADGRHKEDKKGQNGGQTKMREETKPKITRVGRNEIVGFR